MQLPGQTHHNVEHQQNAPDESWKEFISPASFTKPGIFPPSAWTEHIPFAYWLIDAVQPGVFVELGTHYGLSYFSFCHAVQKARLSTACYAIDSWTGDEHAGYYTDTVFDFVQATNKMYQPFSVLHRMQFDEALPLFADASIDLLHIDGLHTYDAVKKDFTSWLPKLSVRGIMLFHDIQVIERGFGVHQLWQELKEQYPSFEFKHGFGLGILGVGKNMPAAAAKLFEQSCCPGKSIMIQNVYERLGKLCRVEQTYNQVDEVNIAAGISTASVEQPDVANESYTQQPVVQMPVARQPVLLQEISIQAFWKKSGDDFNEPDSVKKTVALTEVPTTCKFALNNIQSCIQHIRIDPSAEPGIFYLHSITITGAGEETLMDWELIRNTSSFCNIHVFKSIVVRDAWVLVSPSADPIIETAMPSGNLIETGIIHVNIIVSGMDAAFVQKELASHTLEK